MRKLLLGLIGLATLSLGAQNRIVGGDEAEITEVPWQVTLQDDYDDHFCGGSIIDSSWVLTAAHCVESAYAEGMKIGYGTSLLTDNSMKRIAVQAIFVHPAYDSYTTQNDIALIKIDGTFDLDSNAQIIPTVTQAMANAGVTDEGVTARISGWGLLEEWGDASTKLMMVETPVVSNEDANAPHRYNGQITTDMLAAGDLENGGEDACQGDSGGPLAVKDENNTWVLAGVVSWGDGCAQADKPGLYARVSHFEGWIDGIMNGGPIAAMSKDKDVIFQGDTVTFEDLSINDPETRSWIFEGGNPSTSTEENPVIVYAEAGNFDVTLIVSNTKGADTLIYEDYVKVGEYIICDSLFVVRNSDRDAMKLDEFDQGWGDGPQGYISGNNGWEPAGIFESFDLSSEREVKALNIHFAEADFATPLSTIEIGLYQYMGLEPVVSESVKIAEIAADVAENRPTNIDFGSAVNMGTQFMVGVLLSNTNGNNVAIYNEVTDVNYAYSYFGEFDEFGDYYSFEEDYDLKRSLAIDLITCKKTTDSMQVWTINDTSINPIDTGKTDTSNAIIEPLANVNMYPNPAHDQLFIQSNQVTNQVQVFNFSGQMVLQFNRNANHLSIDVSTLERGMYFVEIQNEEGIVRSKVLLK